ncbi:MAG: Gfo/Idh/MocA family oxidoreductase [Ilumatobacteraceae bacterium]
MAHVHWGVIAATSGIYRHALRPAMALAAMHEVTAEASRQDGDDSPYAELLRRHDVDAVYIPLPNSAHKKWIIRALEAGKHVLCEKPLTLSAADTVEVFAVAAMNDRVLMEAYMWPHHPRARRVLELVHSGAIGDVLSVRSVFTYPASDPTDHRFDERGAGALFDVGIYCIAPAMMIAGRDHRAVAAIALRNEIGVDLSMTGFVDWGDGLGGSFDVSFQAPQRRSLEVTGSNGILTLPGHHSPGSERESEIVIDRRDGSREVILVAGANAFVGMIEHFAMLIDGEEPPVFGETQSIRLAHTLDALHAVSR